MLVHRCAVSALAGMVLEGTSGRTNLAHREKLLKTIHTTAIVPNIPKQLGSGPMLVAGGVSAMSSTE